MAPTPARIIRDRRFLALWIAHGVSTFGSSLTTLTLVLLITERTRSVAAVGGLTVTVAVPGILIGLLAGAYVDRWDRRRIMITCDGVRAVLLLALAVVATHPAALAVLYLVALLQASAGTFFDPANVALMQLIVPARDQVRANSLSQTTTVVAELAGTTLAGVLVATVHTYWIAFVIDAATFALSACLVTTIRHPATAPEPSRSSARAAILDGARAVRSSPTLRALLLVFAALSFALGPMAVLLAPYVVDSLHISTAWIGLIQSGDTVGNVLGGIALAVLARRVRPRTLVVAGMAVLSGLIAALAVTTTVLGLTLVYFVFGLVTVAIQIGIGALIQTEVDNALMGRFMSLMSIAPSTVSVLAMAFTGTAAAAVGVRAVFVACGAVLAVSTILARRGLRST